MLSGQLEPEKRSPAYALPRGASLRRRLKPPRWAMAAPALVWWLIFFVSAFAAIFYYSLGQQAPYTANVAVTFNHLSFANYEGATSGVFLRVFWITLHTAVFGTIACLLVGFPIAYAMATRVSARWRPWLLFLLILPYWVSFLLRMFAWRIILAPEGAFSTFLQSLGILSAPIGMLDTQSAVQLGIIYNYLPIAVLPIFVALDRIDQELTQASMDLGAGPIRTFFSVTLPMAVPGIIGAAVLTFALSSGDYVVPAILGGAHGLMIGKLIAIQVLQAQNLPMGAAMAVVLIGLLAVAGAVVALVLLAGRTALRLVRGPAI